jgi:serine/threonine protein kinase
MARLILPLALFVGWYEFCFIIRNKTDTAHQAPESVLDMSYSYKSDVWTFGIVVSEIVNGHEPHEGENQLNVAMQIRDEGYTPPIPDDCDPVLRELMQMCWRVNPDDRPVSQLFHKITDSDILIHNFPK